MGLTNLKIAAITPYTFSLSIGVRKDWPELVAILDKALASMPEKERNRIRDSFIAMRFEHGVDWVRFWRWMIAVVSVSGLFWRCFCSGTPGSSGKWVSANGPEQALTEAPTSVGGKGSPNAPWSWNRP